MPGPRKPISETQDLSRLPPAAAGDAAFRLFCTPSLSERRDPNYRELSHRARYHLRRAEWLRVPTAFGALAAYRIEPDGAPRGTVLLVHGWTSEAAFMTALAEPIRRAGFRVVLFDMPAHGLSPGRRTNLIECAKATLAISETLGPVDAVVAHSMGGLATLLAADGARPIPRQLDFGRIAIIAGPNRLIDVTREFCDQCRMTAAGRRHYERHLERVGWRALASVSTSDLLLRTGRRPALIVHSRDDADVPFERAEEIVASVPGAQLAAFDGLGHRAILFASPSVRAVVRFLGHA